ncbi:lmo0937 family membrane protein [Dokdonia ponticola]|uniref:Lmo0937 family membrane protein n=1 Tax=Dokdonia ponticola TaxID=2041041 RepID=A0ABV9I009_9FLAO
MRGLLHIIAVILVTGWALGFFVYDVGPIIHILLLMALIAVLVKLLSDKTL